MVVERDEGGLYVASVVELPGCHTQSKSLDQLSRRVREALEGYLEVSEPGNRPEFIGVRQFRMKSP